MTRLRRAVPLVVLLTSLASPASAGPEVQQHRLTPTSPISVGLLGGAVALSSDGRTALVGATQESDSPTQGNGAAYVFVRSGDSWIQQARLRAEHLKNGAVFGWSVALSSDGATALIGAPYEDEAGTDTGAAYLFVRSGETWTQQKLTPDDPSAQASFGCSVALSGDGGTALLGAFGKSDAPLEHNGAAYLFRPTAGVWTQRARLIPDDQASDDGLGNAVALSNDGQTALVGASFKTGPSTNLQGAAYVFTPLGEAWTQQARLTPSDPVGFGLFGHTLGLSGDGSTALLAAYGVVQFPANSTAAFVFRRTGDAWSQEAKLTADPPASDQTGHPVALSNDGNTALLAVATASTAPLENNGEVYLFTHATGQWSQQERFTAQDAASGDGFGSSLALSADGSALLVSAPYRSDPPLVQNGAAYVLTRSKESGTTCAAADACQSGFCVGGVCCDSACPTGTCASGSCLTEGPGGAAGASGGAGGDAGHPPSGISGHSGIGGAGLLGGDGAGQGAPRADASRSVAGDGCGCGLVGGEPGRASGLLLVGLLGLTCVRRTRSRGLGRG